MSAECHKHGTDLVYPDGSWPVGVCEACEREQAEEEWSAYAVTMNQRVERLLALARRRGIDEEAIREAFAVPGVAPSPSRREAM